MVAALALFANVGASRPARLVLFQAPIAGNASALIPAPIIEVQDASGRRVRDAKVDVHVVAVEDSTSLLGTRTVTAAGGLATFNNVTRAVSALERITLRFSAEGLAPVTVTLGSPVGPTLWLDHAELNGQELAPDDRVLTIGPGGSDSGGGDASVLGVLDGRLGHSRRVPQLGRQT